MRDEMDGRLWVEHHSELTDLIHKAVTALRETIRVALCKLFKIQFDAPWKERTTEEC